MRDVDEVPSRTNLVQSIIKVISRETPTEIIGREVDLVTKFESYTRTSRAKPPFLRYEI